MVSGVNIVSRTRKYCEISENCASTFKNLAVLFIPANNIYS